MNETAPLHTDPGSQLHWPDRDSAADSPDVPYGGRHDPSDLLHEPVRSPKRTSSQTPEVHVIEFNRIGEPIRVLTFDKKNYREKLQEALKTELKEQRHLLF